MLSKDIFGKLREIITSSENDINKSEALLHKMKPKDVDQATHNEMVKTLIQDEI